MPERMDNIIKKFFDILDSEFTESDFKNLVNTMDNNDNDVALQAVLFDRMVASGAASAIEGTSDPIKYRRSPNTTSAAKDV